MLIAGHEMSSCYAIVDSHKLEVLRLWFVLMRESNEEASVRLWMKFAVIVEGIQLYLKSFGRISIGSIYCETYFQVYTITLLSEIILFDQATYISFFERPRLLFFSSSESAWTSTAERDTSQKPRHTMCSCSHWKKLEGVKNHSWPDDFSLCSEDGSFWSICSHWSRDRLVGQLNRVQSTCPFFECVSTVSHSRPHDPKPERKWLTLSSSSIDKEEKVWINPTLAFQRAGSRACVMALWCVVMRLYIPPITWIAPDQSNKPVWVWINMFQLPLVV